jgi:hypothetical protein
VSESLAPSGVKHVARSSIVLPLQHKSQPWIFSHHHSHKYLLIVIDQVTREHRTSNSLLQPLRSGDVTSHFWRESTTLHTLCTPAELLKCSRRLRVCFTSSWMSTCLLKWSTTSTHVVRGDWSWRVALQPDSATGEITPLDGQLDLGCFPAVVNERGGGWKKRENFTCILFPYC